MVSRSSNRTTATSLTFVSVLYLGCLIKDINFVSGLELSFSKDKDKIKMPPAVFNESKTQKWRVVHITLPEFVAVLAQLRKCCELRPAQKHHWAGRSNNALQ